MRQLASASIGGLHMGDDASSGNNRSSISPKENQSPGFSFFQVHVAGFSAPTPIQAQSWPIALQSRDIVAIAKTGSGKTLGYLMPAFMHLKRCGNNSKLGPTALVLSPTRELATQIQDEAVKFGKSSRISCVVSNCTHFLSTYFIITSHFLCICFFASAWAPWKIIVALLTNLRM